jgi:hypothetical protein
MFYRIHSSEEFEFSASTRSKSPAVSGFSSAVPSGVESASFEICGTKCLLSVVSSPSSSSSSELSCFRRPSYRHGPNDYSRHPPPTRIVHRCSEPLTPFPLPSRLVVIAVRWIVIVIITVAVVPIGRSSFLCLFCVLVSHRSWPLQATSCVHVVSPKKKIEWYHRLRRHHRLRRSRRNGWERTSKNIIVFVFSPSSCLLRVTARFCVRHTNTTWADRQTVTSCNEHPSVRGASIRRGLLFASQSIIQSNDWLIDSSFLCCGEDTIFIYSPS